MKIAILTTLLSVATAFVVPSSTTTTTTRSPTLLREAAEESESSSSFQGSEAISALTAGLNTVFTNEDIAKVLPHRYPFLLVDKVVEYEAGKVCIS